MGVRDQHHTPAASLPGMTQYPLDRRLVGSQGQPGWVGIILLPPGFDPQTVKPVASHYTIYTILVHSALCGGSQTLPTGKNPSTHWTKGVGHTAGMNILQGGKSLALAGSPACSPVTIQTTLSWLLSIVDILLILAQTVGLLLTRSAQTW